MRGPGPDERSQRRSAVGARGEARLSRRGPGGEESWREEAALRRRGLRQRGGGGLSRREGESAGAAAAGTGERPRGGDSPPLPAGVSPPTHPPGAELLRGSPRFGLLQLAAGFFFPPPLCLSLLLLGRSTPPRIRRGGTGWAAAANSRGARVRTRGAASRALPPPCGARAPRSPGPRPPPQPFPTFPPFGNHMAF